MAPGLLFHKENTDNKLKKLGKAERKGFISDYNYIKRFLFLQPVNVLIKR